MSSNRQTQWQTVAGWTALVLLMSFSAFVSLERAAAGKGTETPQESGPAAGSQSPAVLVELFTSEGCSSCPPADKLLADLDQSQPINGAQVIILSEHVDYWNRLGWKDPFSSAQFSQRQSDYARALGIEDVYTPQMVVDGRSEFVGSKRESALDAIAKAARSPKAAVVMAVKTSGSNSATLTIRVDNVPELRRGEKADVLLAIAESGLRSKVTRGENSGRDLGHSAVTRKLIKIGTIDGVNYSSEPVLNLDTGWNRKSLKAVAFVQERTTRRVIGAAAVKLGEM